jgi:alpha-amylase/alpha-mannosidase (GH57 family)
MTRFVCIHGHFYQPPRENAWLEEIEIQDSAAPFHDWNERVTAECYAPNAAARILDAEDRIVDIVNNYASISFDAGPTLLAWMEKASPEVYKAILDADRESRGRFRGHGSAMAQAYNHLIMPLAGSRDKRTQVVWGMADFEARFGRKPEGMWLPETGVDLESLDIMAENGILFAVLSPYQACRVRDIGGGDWRDVGGGRIDPRLPYLCRLPSGRTIALFFYNGPISHDVAFGDLLQNGERFAKRLLSAFSGGDGPSGAARPELVHIATDGETYGHHHRFGDMALAYALNYVRTNSLAEVTIYGDYLQRFPPASEVEIIERTSWSCAHGIERWRSDCGDNSGAHPGWNQKWRRPLRGAMGWLAAKAASVYEKGMAEFSQDPWKVREEYIRLVLDRAPGTVGAFVAGHAGREPGAAEKTRFLKLLEIERQAMLIFTSDGWFFDDISNIETVQVVQYASRLMQLVRDVGGADPEPEYVRMLGKAASNVPEYKNGAKVYDLFVRPAFVDFLRLCAHYAVSSLFEEYPRAAKIGPYSASADVRERAEDGRRKLAVGRATFTSAVTLEQRPICYAVLYLGDQDLVAGVKDFDGDERRFERTARRAREAFVRRDTDEVKWTIEKDFGARRYSLGDLFKDEKRKVLGQILEATVSGLEADNRKIFEANRAVMEGLREMQIPLPEALAAPAAFVVNADLRRLIDRDETDVEALRKAVEEFRRWSFKPDQAGLGFAASRRIGLLMAKLEADPWSARVLKDIVAVFEILKPLALDLDLWRSQNICVSLSRRVYGEARKKVARGEAGAKDWLACFDALGGFLRVNPAAVREK